MKKLIRYMAYLFVVGVFFISTNVMAETYTDASNKFVIDYNEKWQKSHNLSPSVTFSLMTVDLLGSGRPSARMKVEVSELSDKIPLQRYIDNSIKTATTAWSVLDESEKAGLGDESRQLTLERKIGKMKSPMQKMFVKANGNVYELTCSMDKDSDDTVKQACDEVLSSFQLAP